MTLRCGGLLPKLIRALMSIKSGLTHPTMTKLFFISKQRKSTITTLSAWGFKVPLKHAGARNKRGGVSARMFERSESRSGRLDWTAAGAFVFRGVAFFRFLSWRSKKGRPRGG
ncbi:hypothetical protein CSQ88_05975 [Iodobacter sp. BJB302]|nr:hypothetical protein CSQ88_05975 [Iodobacter sp. BJB302]